MAIFTSGDIITVSSANITAASTATGFAAANVMNHGSLKRRWRMDSASMSSITPVMYFDMGAAKTVSAIVLDDVNFDKCSILGHASSLSTDWSGATFATTGITISKDTQVNRYKSYIPLASFNYRFLAICIPETATAVGDYTSKWEIGRVGILDSGNEMTTNMSEGYERGAERAYEDLELKSGHVERTERGPIRWVGTLMFGKRSLTSESDLTTLNNTNISDTIIFYENNCITTDTSKVYFCLRDDNYKGTYTIHDIITGSSIRLRERI